MARGLDILLQQEVASVVLGEVRLVNGERVTADRILCTVPLEVLKAGRITFNLPLDPAMQAAIDGLSVGVVNKLWLRFDRATWPVDLDWFTSACRVHWAAWASFARMDGLPVLSSFSVANHAGDLWAMSDHEIFAAATDELRRLFGSSFPSPRAAQVTRWNADPFARGSYGFNAVGLGARERHALATPKWDGLFGSQAKPPRHGITELCMVPVMAAGRRPLRSRDEPRWLFWKVRSDR